MLVTLALRSRETDYLAYVANRDSLMVSHAFEAVLAEMAQLVAIPEKPKRTRKERLHISIGKSWAVYIKRLVVLWGVPQSEVARRLLEMARARDGLV